MLKRYKMLLVIISCLTLVACNNENTDGSKTDKGKETKEVTKTKTESESIELVLSHNSKTDSGYNVTFTDKNTEKYSKLGLDKVNINIISFIPNNIVEITKEEPMYGQTYDVTFEDNLVTSFRKVDGVDVWKGYKTKDKTNIVVIYKEGKELDNELVNKVIQKYSSEGNLNVVSDFNIANSVRDYTEYNISKEDIGVVVFKGDKHELTVIKEEDLTKAK